MNVGLIRTDLMSISPLKKLAIVSALFVANLFLIPTFKGTEAVGYLIFTLCIVLFPILVLSIIDALGFLKSSPEETVFGRLLAVVLSIPAFLLGLGTFAIGASIILWVLYNIFVERQPEYTGPGILLGVASFGMGGPIAALGIWWMILAVKRRA